MKADFPARLLDESPDAVIATTPDGKVLFWSKGAESIFGYTSGESLGREVDGLIVPAEYRGEERRLLEETLITGASTHEAVRSRKDGSRIYVDVSRKAVRDAAGAVEFVLSTKKDITHLRLTRDAKVADLERHVVERTAELEAANKELESFDHSVSHDLRAPINRIAGFSAMLLDAYAEKLDERGKDLLMRIEQAGRVMDQLVGDLFALSTASRGELRRSDVNLGALAEEIVGTLRKGEPQREVRFEVTGTLTARADPGMVRAVLVNLLGNAWKFSGKRADAHIQIGCLDSPGGRTFFVRDNGAGFDSTKAEKLFSPFQRLHAASDFAGTGIGLATVQRIVRRHGGHVWAESEPGKGATFFFTLET